jgi:hypothetical protein
VAKGRSGIFVLIFVLILVLIFVLDEDRDKDRDEDKEPVAAAVRRWKARERELATF